MDPAPSHELFPHIRIVMGMVIGLGITRLLTGIAGLIQHPKRHRRSAIHLMWVFSMLVELVLFWWWEFALSRVPNLNFGIFLFLIFYAITLFLISALLFPDDLDEYGDYEEFFLDRRRWFFGLFALTFFFDIVDTAIKGAEHWGQFSTAYVVQIPLGLALCVVACLTRRRSVQLAVAAFHIGYQFFWLATVLEATG
ncbi:hypothetical protein ABE438_06190 [Bosea sp. TWI1241]|uniref:hypothetical protein n=1 Tax=Bosea sp. TWI1241 TaxID=3148904 RepID=UPI00320B85B4